MAQVKSAVRVLTILGNDTRASQRRASSSAAQPAAATAEAARPSRAFDEIPGPSTLPFLGLAAHAHLLPRIGVYHHAACPLWLENARERYGDMVRLGCAGDLPRARSRRRPALLLYRPRDMAQVYESGCTETLRVEWSPLLEHRRLSSADPSQAGEGVEAFSSPARVALLALERGEEVSNRALQHVTERLLDSVSGQRGRERAPELNASVERALQAWAAEAAACALLAPPARAPAALLRVARHSFALGHAQRSERTLRAGTPFYRDAVASFDTHFRLCEEWLDTSAAEGGLTSKELSSFDRQQLARALADLLLAGADALQHTAARLLYYLALNPAKQQRLRDELACCGGGAAGGGGARYAAACVRETLRLHAACALVRRAVAPLVVAGYTVPPGVDIVLAHQTASRSEREFGRARAFVPERWTCERGAPLHAGHAHAAATCPFGPRPGARGYGGRPMEAARSRAALETSALHAEVEIGGGAVAGGCPGRGLAERALATLAAKMATEHTVEWHGPRAHLDTTSLHHMPPPYHFVLQKA